MKIIDYKKVDMTDEEFAYYQNLVKEFTLGTYDGKEQFRDLFETDEDGCIMMIHPSLQKEIAWSVLFFIQNLMINQRLRRMEKVIEKLGDTNDKKSND